MSRRTLSLLACALGLLAGAASPAAAEPTKIGGCGLLETADRVRHPWDRRGPRIAEIDVEMAIVSSGGEPLTATVTCFLLRNGSEEMPGGRLVASGTGLVVGGGVVTYERQQWDFIMLCEEVDYAGSTPDTSECYWPPSYCMDCAVPYQVWDILIPTYQEACATAGEAATDLGVARVEEDGDVYVERAVDFSCWPFD